MRSTIIRSLILVVSLTAGLGVLIAAVLIAPYDAVTELLELEKPPVTVAGGDPALGKEAIMEYGCMSCHTIPGVAAADATVGPPLTAWADRRYIAGLLPNEPDNLIAWIVNPQAFEPGTAMPTLGVSEEDARDIAAYLYTLEEEK